MSQSRGIPFRDYRDYLAPPAFSFKSRRAVTSGCQKEPDDARASGRGTSACSGTRICTRGCRRVRLSPDRPPATQPSEVCIFQHDTDSLKALLAPAAKKSPGDANHTLRDSDSSRSRGYLRHGLSSRPRRQNGSDFIRNRRKKHPSSETRARSATALSKFRPHTCLC